MAGRRRVLDADQLLVTATALVAERGVEGLHLAHLAAVNDVAVGTLYNHFPSKAHLLAAIRRRVEHEFVVAMDDAAPPGTALREAVPRLVDALLATAAASPVAAVLQQLPAAAAVAGGDRDGAAVRDWIAQRVRQAQDDGEVAVVDADLVADLAFDLVAAGLAHARPQSLHEVRALLAGGLAGLLPPAPVAGRDAG